jgi:hypothetical protein
MERGTMLEPRARAWYELKTGADVARVGFVLRDDGRCGASPDGLFAGGVLEIKCLGRVAHLSAVLDNAVPADYVAQVQGEMWCAEVDRADFVLFTDDTGIPSAVIEVSRDKEYCAVMESSVAAFCDELDALEKRLREMGGGVPDGPMVTDNSAGIMRD